MGTSIDDDFEAEDSDERRSADDLSRQAARGDVNPARHRRMIERYWEQRRLRKLLEDFDSALPDVDDEGRRVR